MCVKLLEKFCVRLSGKTLILTGHRYRIAYILHSVLLFHTACIFRRRLGAATLRFRAFLRAATALYFRALLLAHALSVVLGICWFRL